MSAPGPDIRVVDTGTRERGRVLLISEESDQLLTKTLEAIGLEIVGVSRGSAALISLQRSRPHIVIASASVKGISTAELARMLAQTQDGLPLIVVGSEPATVERRRDALATGAFDYFHIPAELPLLAARACQLVALRQMIDRLRADADLDFLTGVANRRRFRQALTREVVADTLIAVSRRNDTAARLGGEEFALLLAGTSGEKAERAAERLRTILAESNIEGAGTLTVSIGVAACPEHANSERSLYAASDRALYVAKNAGRNRVSVAPLIQEKLPGV